MAAAPAHSHHLFSGLLLAYLLALQWALLSGVEVTQQPPFVRKPQNKTLELNCTVDQDNYDFYWYRQVPGQTELQYLGISKAFGNSLEDKPKGDLATRLSSTREGKQVFLTLTGLQSQDTGLYLCGSRHTVILEGTGTHTKLSAWQ
ncbi:hypothetical protein lerEdw1_011267 [Lerista edwardsae]|nr:hypothetical protein lerEdw1_011267 [Lerista edwardsae]